MDAKQGFRQPYRSDVIYEGVVRRKCKSDFMNPNTLYMIHILGGKENVNAERT